MCRSRGDLDNGFNWLFYHFFRKRLARHFFAVPERNRIGDIALPAFSGLYNAVFARFYRIIHFGDNGELLLHEFGDFFGFFYPDIAFLVRRIYQLKAAIVAASAEYDAG